LFGGGRRGLAGARRTSEPQATPSACREGDALAAPYLRAALVLLTAIFYFLPHLLSPTPSLRRRRVDDCTIEACIARTHKTHLVSVSLGQRPCALPRSNSVPSGESVEIGPAQHAPTVGGVAFALEAPPLGATHTSNQDVSRLTSLAGASLCCINSCLRSLPRDKSLPRGYNISAYLEPYA